VRHPAGMMETMRSFVPLLRSPRLGKGMNGRHVRSAAIAFTLVELLVVIGILALLASILFPVFSTVRGKARQISCLSNIRQLGQAFLMYGQDYDGLVPWAKDASDAYVPRMWESQPRCKELLPGMPFVHPTPERASQDSQEGALAAYVRSRTVWRCPSDTGFDYLDHNDSCDGPCPLSARPTMHQAFGSSYLYRTELAFRRVSLDTLSGVAIDGSTVGPSSIHLLFDGNGSWHGGWTGLLRRQLRYNAVFADGHASSLDWDRYWSVWSIDLSGGNPDLPCP